MTTQDHVLTSDKWGLSAVSAPIRRGTASRLGLRTPPRYAVGGPVRAGDPILNYELVRLPPGGIR